MGVGRYIEKDCIVCGSRDHKEIYSSKQPAGDILGELIVTLHVCTNCGFVWQNPQLSKEVLAEYYTNDVNASGSVFHASHANSRHIRKQKDRIAFFKPFLQRTSPNGTMVEIGCSTGEFLSALDLPEWDKHGIEPSATAAAIANAAGIKILQQSIDNIELKASEFDAVAAFSVIEHLSDLPEIMAEISKTLKPGGLLLFEIPDSLKARPQLAEFFGYEHLWHFTATSIAEFLSKYGLNIITFDETVADPRLRAVAVKDVSRNDLGMLGVTGDFPLLQEVIQKYQERRITLIKDIGDKIDEFLQDLSPQDNFAIYGAGIHTRHLFEHFHDLLNASYVIDSNAKRWGGTICGIPIISVENATEIEKRVRKVIISSNAFESEIFDSLVSLGKAHDFDILKLYS